MKPAVHLGDGLDVTLIWKERAGIESREIRDAHFFDNASALARDGYARFMMEARCEAEFVEELLAKLRARQKCRCGVTGKGQPPTGLVYPFKLGTAKRGQRQTHRWRCGVCGRFWDVASGGGKPDRTSRVAVRRWAYRRWSIVTRSGGTPFDCVEHDHLVVDALGVHHTATDDAGRETNQTFTYEEFLNASRPIPEVLGNLVSDIDVEIRRWQKFLKRSAEKPRRTTTKRASSSTAKEAQPTA